jgi:hypothetical protein
MPFLQFIMIGAAELILTFSLGYLTLRAATELSIKECLALADAVGIAVAATIAFLAFLLGFYSRTFFGLRGQIK